MKTIFACTVLLASSAAAADAPTPEIQIAAAVLAAPAELRNSAAVLGYNPQGEVVKLREGKNELICLASDPGKTRFSVACYHRDLEPYMARGRELLAQKVTGQKRNDIRWKEVADGKLSMPREPRTLHAQCRGDEIISRARAENHPHAMTACRVISELLFQFRRKLGHIIEQHDIVLLEFHV